MVGSLPYILSQYFPPLSLALSLFLRIRLLLIYSTVFGSFAFLSHLCLASSSFSSFCLVIGVEIVAPAPEGFSVVRLFCEEFTMA